MSVCVCVYVCVHVYYSHCGDLNLFTQSRRGDSHSLWGLNACPRNVNHLFLGQLFFRRKEGRKGRVVVVIVKVSFQEIINLIH